MELNKIDEASETYLGQWNTWSAPNWERAALSSSGGPPSRKGATSEEFTDEAWSRRVGNVSPQHVGRLRRAYDPSCRAHPRYPGLYWSHFQAGLDWDDAEMWLEGAVQNRWPISELAGTLPTAAGAFRRSASDSGRPPRATSPRRPNRGQPESDSSTSLDSWGAPGQNASYARRRRPTCCGLTLPTRRLQASSENSSLGAPFARAARHSKIMRPFSQFVVLTRCFHWPRYVSEASSILFNSIFRRCIQTLRGGA